MELREATADDFEAITRLITSPAELFRVYPKGHYPLTVAQLQALAGVRCDLTVATERGAVFGFANLYDVHPGHYAFVGNVIVAQSHRGRGLGRGLVSHMITLALQKYALQEVRISVFSDNMPALLMYSALGFHPGTIEERRDWEGRRVALLHMALPGKGWEATSRDAPSRR